MGKLRYQNRIGTVDIHREEVRFQMTRNKIINQAKRGKRRRKRRRKKRRGREAKEDDQERKARDRGKW